jgi:hypothetical protein
MLNSNDMEKAKLVQMGLQQFERLHLPVEKDGFYSCEMCDLDFPCDRMLTFMLLQSIVSMQAMLPSGNIGGIMSRFAGGGKS